MKQNYTAMLIHFTVVIPKHNMFIICKRCQTNECMFIEYVQQNANLKWYKRKLCY